MDENRIRTPYGVFGGIASVEYYEEGRLKGIRLNEKNMIVTHAGELIPFYSQDSQRRKYKASVSFYREGTIKSVSLDRQQEILTPIGEFPAELVTFYPTGELKRFFPLDGKISGFWSEEDERNLNIPFSFAFDFASFSAMLIGVCFYKSGDIRSVTLFPKENIKIATKYGEIEVKTGFSLYESGELESLEPAVPTKITTPIGVVAAYDVSAVGINADSNSVCFDESGRIIGLTTSNDKIAVRKPDGTMQFFASAEKRSPLDENEIEWTPLKVEFDYSQNTVTLSDASSRTFSIESCTFYCISGNFGCNPEDCAGCSLCEKG